MEPASRCAAFSASGFVFKRLRSICSTSGSGNCRNRRVEFIVLGHGVGQSELLFPSVPSATVIPTSLQFKAEGTQLSVQANSTECASMATTEVAQEAIGYVGVSHEEIESTSKVQTFVHTEALNGDANDLWEACKHAVALLPDIAPEYFAKAGFAQGSGGPGSISVFHFGPAVPGGGCVKHQVQKLDHKTKTLGYTVLDEGEGASSYSSFDAEMQFTATEDSKTEATWTVKYEPVGEAGPPEDVKEMVIISLKTMEKAVAEKRVVRHTRTLEAPADTIWNILMHEDVILPKIIPHIIASYEFLEGNGEAGSIRLLKLGHAIPGGKHVVERIDMNDGATKRWGYTVLQGDPKYKYLSAVMQFLPGPEEGTTTAKWVGVYVPQNATMPPPDLALHVWKVFENVAKSSPQAVY